MRNIEEIIGTTEEEFKLDGTNKVDIFPIFTYEPGGASSPDSGSITIQGVAMPCLLWAEGEFIGATYEIPHTYKNGAYIDFHVRGFPVNDNAGDISFSFNYFVLHVDGTTSAGGTLTATGTITAGDKTANKGFYIEDQITVPTGLVDGDQLCGRITRDSIGGYGSDIAEMEFGMHVSEGKVGNNAIT